MLITPIGFRNTRIIPMGVTPAQGELDFLQSAQSGSDLTTYTFSSQNLGSADSDRYIAVTIYGSASTVGRTLQSVTIGGIGATIVQDVELSDSPNTQKGAVAIAKVPSGTSGDVVVTWAGSMLRCGIAMYRLVGLESRIPTVITSQLTASQTDVTMNVDIPANSAVIAMVGNAGTGTEDWTGVTEDYGEDIEFSRFTGGSEIYLNSSDSQAIECDMTSATAKSFGVCVVWQFGTSSQPVDGMAAWYAADFGVFSDAGVTLATDGSTVQRWNDLSGNGLHMSQATSGIRPIFRTNEVNQLPAVYGGTASNRRMTSSRILSDDHFTIFIVTRAAAQDNKAIYSQHDGGVLSGRMIIGPNTGANTDKFYLFFNNGSSFTAISTSSVFDNANYNVLITTSDDAGTSAVRVNSGAVEADVTGQTFTPLNTSSRLFHVGTNSNIYTGSVSEIIIYERLLTDDERADVLNYLGDKYGTFPLTGFEWLNTASDMENLALWYDMSDATTLYTDEARTTNVSSDGDAIASIEDKSGNARHATQSVSGERPLYKTAIQNSMSAARFDGTDDGMVTSFTLNNPYTIYVVEKVSAVAAGRRTINSQDINALISVGARNSGNNAYVNGKVSDFGAGSGTHIGGLAIGGASRYIVNGTNRASATNITANWGQFNLGNEGSVAEPAGTDLLEVLVYSEEHTEYQMQGIIDMLNDKWAAY